MLKLGDLISRRKDSLVVIALLTVAVALLSYYSIPPSKLPDLLLNGTYLFFLTAGVCVVLATGEIDLSVYGVSSFAAVLALWTSSFVDITNAFAMLLLTIGYAVALSLLNAVLIVSMKLPSVLVTLSTFSSFFGFGLLIYLKTARANESVYVIPDSVKSLLGMRVAGLRIELIIIIVALMILWIALQKSKLGLAMKAIGQSPTSAQYSGLNLTAIRFLAFIIAGVLYGIGSFLSYSRFSSTRPSEMLEESVTPILCGILAGADIMGGRLPLFFVVLGVSTFLCIKELVMAQPYFPSEAYHAVFGSVLLLYIILRYKTRIVWRTT